MATATLADGSTIEYFPDPIGEGAMKIVYLTADKSSVICFYKDSQAIYDNNRLARLDAILNSYNPTLKSNGEYYKNLFCWTTAIVTQPYLGIITPVYPSNYFFSTGNWKGKEKEGKWFVGKTASGKSLRDLLPKEEQGTWINYLKICIVLSRAVRRLHQAGLAHSDLSNKNVLIDPTTGSCIVIDIDSLVVPGLFPPDVLGTRGYIAPEVLKTIDLPLEHPQRKHPCIETDQHALAVLIYQYLFCRHPLQGPKTYPASSGEEQERLEMGSRALFIEHPQDTSNRPSNITIPYNSFGSHLTNLFQRAFIEGLHAPQKRPAATEWERGLIKTWDLLHPCTNNYCSSKWFVFDKSHHSQCPFCGSQLKGNIPILRLRKQITSGAWTRDGQVVVYHNLSLFKWHAFDNIFPGPEADKTPQAYCVFHQGQWLLINQNLASLSSPQGNLVPPQSAIKLEDGVRFQLSQDAHGRLVEVQMI